MEIYCTNNDVFGSRGRVYLENGASPAAIEQGRLYNGHQGVKDIVNQANVTKQPQTPVSPSPSSPSPRNLQSFQDTFEQQPVAEETMSFAKMAAAMASMRARA